MLLAGLNQYMSKLQPVVVQHEAVAELSASQQLTDDVITAETKHLRGTFPKPGRTVAALKVKV